MWAIITKVVILLIIPRVLTLINAAARVVKGGIKMVIESNNSRIAETQFNDL